MTLVEFKTQFPEFSKTADSLLLAMLAASELEIDRNAWGAKGDQGQGYLTAHKLCASPWGQNAKLTDKSGKTTYYHEYFRLMRMVATGPRVL